MCLCRDEWDLCKNHQSLALIGLGYGALVLNDLFLKAMTEVVTSSTGAGAFVRNLKGFALYQTKTGAMKLKSFSGGGRCGTSKLTIWSWIPPVRSVKFKITQGSLHIDSDIYGNNVTHDVRIYCTCTNSESSCGLMSLVFSLQIFSFL